MDLSRTQNILVSITAFLILASNRLIFVYSLGNLYFFEAYLPFVIVICLLLILFFSKKRYKIQISTLIIVNSVLWLNVLTAYINGCSSGEIKSAILLLFFVNVIIIYVDKIEKNGCCYLLEYINNIIYFLAFTSFFIWIFGPVLNIIQPTVPLLTSWGEGTWVNNCYLLLCCTPSGPESLGGVELLPNQSIFVERAFAAYSFCISLFIELFLVDKKRLIRILFLLAAIISTTSTTGIIMSAMAIAAYILMESRSNGRYKVFFILLIPVAMVFAYHIISDLIIAKQDTISGETRTDDILNGFRAWLDSPIFGWGYMNRYVLDKYHTGFSNSIVAILAQGGIILLSLYFVPFVKFIKRNRKITRMNVLLFGGLFYILFSGNIVAFNCCTIYIIVVIAKILTNRNNILYVKD